MKIKKVGEPKECSRCGEIYEHFTTNKNSACKPCRAVILKEKNKLTEEERKKPYPLTPNDRDRRYTRLRRALDKCNTREELNQYYDNVLKEMEDMGILKWCTDLRPGGKIIQRGIGAGRRKKEHTDANLKYPNTKGWYE